jgi:transcriptional antiterminator NusG
MPIFTIRTTAGREDVVMDMLESNVRAEKTDVKSIFHPAEIKGYIFIEGGLGAIQKSMHGLMHAKGLIEKPVRMEEIQHFLEQKKAIIRVSEGDTVEIIGGPFRGERGEIKRIDKVKDEVTIELLEASIPIPVTIATEFIKIIKKVKSEEIVREKPAASKPEPVQPEKEAEVVEPGAAAENPSEEKSAFDLKALEERKEARKAKPTQFIFDEPKKDIGKKPVEGEKPSEELKTEEMMEVKEPAGEPVKKPTAAKDELKGGILEELEREEKQRKKKRLEDLEDLE